MPHETAKSTGEREQIVAAIATLEAQRVLLGPETVEAALVGLRQRLKDLEPIPTLSGERKLVTVMFADISGFTALSEKLDPEHVRSLMNDCFDALVPVVEKYGGVVDKFIGDEIMALFGAPRAHENDAERALRAALEMMETLHTFNIQRHVQLGMHFGLNTGLVVAGGLGSAGRQQYSVMGDTVNLAARLQDASEAGQILVGPNTHRLTAPLFNFDMLPPLRVKGKTEPVAVHRLLRLKDVPGPVRGLNGLRSPMIARDAELHTLLHAIQALSSGKGGVISILAEAGLGKSRLVSEVRQATQETARWAEGRALSYAEGISYWVGRSVLDNLIGVGPDTPLGEIKNALRSFVQFHLPNQWEEVFAYLARLRDLPLDAESDILFKDVLPAAIQHRMRQAFSNLIRACSAKQPLVLVWEDLHWSDPSSLGLLETLLPLTEAMPLLLLMVFRPEDGYQWDWHRHLQETLGTKYRVVELSPLSQIESARLVDNLLKIENLPEVTHHLILSKSEGNPFFLEELLRSLIDTGLVILDAERAIATKAINQLEVPDTLQGVIAARIDRLPAAGKYTLQTASVIGRVFQQVVLGYLLQQDHAEVPLEIALDELQQRELIRWRGELEYIFKHAITRDVTYNSLLIARRKELHHLTAGTIEMLFPEQLDELSPSLAYHYGAAEAYEKAVHYLTRAAVRAQHTYANTEAIAFYRAAIEQIEQLYSDMNPLEMGRREKLANLYEKLGSVLNLIGKADEAKQAFELALPLIAEADAISRARLYRRLGLAYNVTRQMEEMHAHYALALASLGAPPETPSSDWLYEWIELQLDRCWVYYFSSQVTELSMLVTEVGPVIQKHGDAPQRSRFFETLTLADLRHYRYFQLPDKTVNQAQLQLVAAEETGNRRTIGRAKVIKGFVHLWRDELIEAEQYFLGGLRDTEHVGDLETQIIGWNYMALIGRKRGDVGMTRQWAERTLALVKPVNSAFYIASAYGSLGWVAWREGNETQATMHLQEAQTAIAKFPTPKANSVVFLFIGPLLGLAVRQAKWGEAIEHAKVLLSPWCQKMPEDVEEALRRAVQAWEGDQTAEAHACLAQSLELMRQKPMGYL